MRRMWVIGFVLALAGCAVSRPVWVHPTATESQAQRDNYECRRDALMVPQLPAPAPPPPPGPPTGGGWASGFAKGWDEGVQRGIYYRELGRSEAQAEMAAELFGLCMRSKGYQRRWVTE